MVETLQVNVFQMLIDLFVAVSGSLGIGAVVALLIQIGKRFLPKIFADGSAQNFRVGFIFLIALFLYVAPTFGLKVDLPGLDAMAKSLAELSAMLAPVFIMIADSFSKKFYDDVLRGVNVVGKTYSK